ncbi:hypothetical protein ABIE21_003493 [Conyzicola nivalis]|uniref:Uncharacterized protein n=1 Tax=Conyzicola nivalis TaxID=1477021 RepID=A0ABV2QU42_9MICO
MRKSMATVEVEQTARCTVLSETGMSTPSMRPWPPPDSSASASTRTFTAGTPDPMIARVSESSMSVAERSRWISPSCTYCSVLRSSASTPAAHALSGSETKRGPPRRGEVIVS